MINKTLLTAICSFENLHGIDASSRDVGLFVSLCDAYSRIETLSSADTNNMYWEDDDGYGYGANAFSIEITENYQILITIIFHNYENNEASLLPYIMSKTRQTIISRESETDRNSICFVFDSIWKHG